MAELASVGPRWAGPASSTRCTQGSGLQLWQRAGFDFHALPNPGPRSPWDSPIPGGTGRRACPGSGTCVPDECLLRPVRFHRCVPTELPRRFWPPPCPWCLWFRAPIFSPLLPHSCPNLVHYPEISAPKQIILVVPTHFVG